MNLSSVRSFNHSANATTGTSTIFNTVPSVTAVPSKASKMPVISDAAPRRMVRL